MASNQNDLLVVDIVALSLIHFLTFFLALFRILLRTYLHPKPLWLDDGLISATSVANLIIFGVLVSTRLSKNPAFITPLVYTLTLYLYFIVTWVSRAGQIMSMGRIFRGDKFRILRFNVLAAVFLFIGLIYCVAFKVYCDRTSREAIDVAGLTFCSFPEALKICILIVDLAVDAFIISIAWFTFKDTKLTPSEKYPIIIGFASSGWTFISGTICWSILLSRQYPEPRIIVCLANIMTVISTCSSNLPIVLVFLSIKLFRENPSEEFLDGSGSISFRNTGSAYKNTLHIRRPSLPMSRFDMMAFIDTLPVYNFAIVDQSTSTLRAVQATQSCPPTYVPGQRSMYRNSAF
ncbi:hypothetical protein GALMADRAFT_259938 [Galerina marginata CBS 339.88]|uniref:G-protein coupled receptors family 3 profile domain-containing protein n=1 Tax=Galerina marginata (strain CBS 339.88) TaxID=685588 RepID=A0A067SGY0_GALM3|nr:hypothetical protein GALMADRAFT_259938 [Galerina marginata CBS 339.88]